MELADRLHLIQKLAGELSRRDWPEITLVLDQLGVSVNGYGHSTDAYDYCLWHLREVSNDGLAELDRYVGGQTLPSVGAGPTVWDEGYVRAFLSHLSRDKQAVAEVRSHLLNFGIAGFVAHTDIEPTREWVRVIESALQSCDVLVAFLRPPDAADELPGFRDSNWCDQEVGWAAGRGVPLVPLNAGTNPYGFLGQYQAVDIRGTWPADVAESIFLAIRGRDELRPRLFDALVERLVAATGFSEAISAAELLERYVDAWPARRLARLEDALANDQVVNSAGAEPIVSKILRINGVTKAPSDDDVPF